MTTTGRLVNKVSLARGVSRRSPITPADCGGHRWAGGGEPWSRDRSRGSRDRGRTAGPAAPQAAGVRGDRPLVSRAKLALLTWRLGMIIGHSSF